MLLPTLLKSAFSTLSFTKTFITHKPPVAILTMNSAKDKNCFSTEMNHELSTSLNKLSNDPSVNLIILDSSVPNLFSAGGPLKYFHQATSATFENNDLFEGLERSLINLRKPIVTAIDGYALGGAFQLALITDMIICSKRSVLGMPQIKLGISTVLGASQRLPRMVGKMNTGRIILGTENIKPERLMELGVITEVFDDYGFDGKVLEYCQRIAAIGQDQLIRVKEMVREAERNTK